MRIETTSEEPLDCGYLKLKFPLDKTRDLASCEPYAFCCTLTSPRVTLNHVYCTLGHSDIRDNDHARGIIKTTQELGGKVTRIDLYLDIEQTLNFDMFYALHDNGKHPIPSLVKSPQGKTVYIGKRPSPRLLRVYDKRAEIKARSGIDVGYPVTRIELEIKRRLLPRYLTLFMSRRTTEIVNDIQELYYLRNFISRNKRVKVALPTKPKRDDLAFVYKYRAILRRAYLSSTIEFRDILGLDYEPS